MRGWKRYGPETAMIAFIIGGGLVYGLFRGLFAVIGGG